MLHAAQYCFNLFFSFRKKSAYNSLLHVQKNEFPDGKLIMIDGGGENSNAATSRFLKLLKQFLLRLLPLMHRSFLVRQ